MPDFFVGQQVEYRDRRGNVIATGVVDRIKAEWVIVNFADPDLEGGRAFNPDGTVGGFGLSYTDCGVRKANANGGRLVALSSWEPNMSNEYPAEPKIGYGVFNGYGQVVKPAYSGSTSVGFGIMDLPRSITGVVAEEPDNSRLLTYLAYAKEAWKQECLSIDFNAVENKLDFLIGCRLHYSWLYTDQFGTEVRLPVEIDPMQNQHQIVFDYSSICLTTGLLSMEEVQSHLQAFMPVTVTEVEGDKITLSSGTVFHLTSRYRENVQPILNPSNNVKALLMRNLVSQRAKRDSGEMLAA